LEELLLVVRLVMAVLALYRLFLEAQFNMLAAALVVWMGQLGLYH
jgi:hypothetical protein